MIFQGIASTKIKSLYWQRRRKMGYKTPPCTALDNLAMTMNKVTEGQEVNSFSKEDEADSDEDMADLVFRKAILPGRTGDFDKDFPPSPKIPKGGKGKLKKSSGKNPQEDLGQELSVLQCDGDAIPNAKGTEDNPTDCIIGTESNSISSSPARL